MGLTNSATGKAATATEFNIIKRAPQDRIIALAGNPNVGKSTIFNGLTGLNQHTGNWPGKTIANAQGYCPGQQRDYVLVDIPGAYSLSAHSAEEEVARDFICCGDTDGVVVVCDATCLERNLNLVLQTAEITGRVVVCVNLLDEARRKQIHLDLPELAARLGVPVVGVVARRKRSLCQLIAELERLDEKHAPLIVRYPDAVEAAVNTVVAALAGRELKQLNSRWLSLRLLDGDEALLARLDSYLGCDLRAEPTIAAALTQAQQELARQGIGAEQWQDMIVSALVGEAERLCQGVVHHDRTHYDAFDRRLDRVLTGRKIGYPLMLALLALVFWITISGANYPSQLLSVALFWLQARLTEMFAWLNAPEWLHGILVLGVYRVAAWVVSVMLPPMAIFFPLFTLLEDAGYLPRVAYNLDRPFQRCRACGKQALTMCMGFGCNAAGVVGCRIIDSPRERLLAMLTNNFVPCNGRFPTLIALLTMFFVGTSGGAGAGLMAALLLTALIAGAVLLTFAVTRLLSATLLRGVPSSFTLELPPYRRPQIGQVIVRSLCDRTLFVLGRAVTVAAPAGLIIWICANVTLGGVSLLQLSSDWLDPFAHYLGMDGVILLAFILGLPANEIVVPIIIMAYATQGSLVEYDSLLQLHALLTANGWTWLTALSVMIFSLCHWPCATTLLTIKKESGGWKWAALSMLIPTAIGMTMCFLLNLVAGWF